MKKGFTLIELLAVILILGIIALIAIPTVNKIINEARYGAFKSGNENIMKTLEQDCQTSLMKNENQTLSYLFTDGKSSSNINIKGSLPNDGYILMNKNCEITDYYLTEGKNIYSNNDDVREDYMIKKSSSHNSIFKELYSTYYNQIQSVNFVSNLDIPENAVSINDISISGNEKTKSWLVPNGEFYDLYIGSLNKIYSNYDSSYLFEGLNAVKNYNFSNLDTIFSKNFAYLFANNTSLVSIDINSFNTENVETFQSMFENNNILVEVLGINLLNTQNLENATLMFYNCKSLLSLDLTNWNTSKVSNLYGMFHTCFKLENLNVSTWDVSNVVTLEKTFWECLVLKELDLSKWKTSKKLTNLRHTFVRCYKLKTLNLSGFNTENVTDMIATFASATGLRNIIGIENWDTSNLNLQYDGGNSGTFTSLKELESLDLSSWNINNLSNLTYMFHSSIKLKSLDISNWNIDETKVLTNIFLECLSINNIKFSNAESVNNVIEYLPKKSSSSPGTIVIKGDTANLNISALESKYWYAVDSNGNSLHT